MERKCGEAIPARKNCRGQTLCSHCSERDSLAALVSAILFQSFHTQNGCDIFNVCECVGRLTTPCVTFRTTRVKQVLMWSHAGAACVVFLCCFLQKGYPLTALPHTCRNRLCDSSCTRHACVWLFMNECVDQWSRSLSGWSLCFWFLLFFSPFQCFPLLLCSKDKFGRFAKFITFHWWNLPPSPVLNSLLFLPPPFPPGYLYWSVCPLPCASLLFMFEFVMLRWRLGSIQCQSYQTLHCNSCTDDAAFTWSQLFLCFIWREFDVAQVHDPAKSLVYLQDK